MFEARYEEWLHRQKRSLRGEARRRLAEGHSHNEKLFVETVWYPAIGNFDDLYAEYEVRSYKNGCYYMDFAYLRPPYRVCWEVDDFSSHAKNLNRRTHEYHLDRQNELVLDGWIVFRISLDKIRERPRACQQFVLQSMGKLFGLTAMDTPSRSLALEQREIMRLARRLQRPFTPAEASICLGVSDRYVRELLQELVQLELLEAAGGRVRIRSYRLTEYGARVYIP
ncbi:DNA-binding response regulator [Cohnella lubricantis]|uniref:DNA-binding response regulator n=1 Tax=Cohnella lubricantis TaxID=2163172 RepID=A0A841TCJ2_9BACL|nr:DNA-binding response regulator [Cohnella lubricantis]MBB6679024.1 DNA-binding response regulator [Cohnella lubricantis]MBP2119487.1 very-short-patch-repair endonuclease [Cohnella lubricantis]